MDSTWGWGVSFACSLRLAACTALTVAGTGMGALGCSAESAPDVGPGLAVDANVASQDAGPDAASGVDGEGRDSGPPEGPPDATAPLDTGFDSDSGGTADGGSSSVVECSPLGAPTGPTIALAPNQAGELPQIVGSASEGTTILLSPGVYRMSGNESERRIVFSTPGVTLRSTTGERSDVVIDGEYLTQEILFIRADDVTIADLTVRRAVDHLIHITGAQAGTIHRTRLHNLALFDSGEQFVKVNSDGQGHYVDDGELTCSWLRLTPEGRGHVEPNPGGCYTGGIDAHGARGWRVRLNRFEGIYCDNGSLAEHAVHFWSGSRDTLVERNIIESCARGVGFGLAETGTDRPYPDDPYPDVGYVGHYDGIIRNNLIFATAAASAYFDTGIELAQARGAIVLHNTLPTASTFSSIDHRFSNTSVTIRNNVTHRITSRNGAEGVVDHNLVSVLDELFRDAAGGDYRLRSSAVDAIDRGVVVDEAGLDLDGLPHDVGLPDLGAYEAR